MTLADGPHTIWLSTRSIIEKESKLAAGASITPGMLIQFDGANEAVEPHSSAAALPKPLMVAVEATWKYSAGIDTPLAVEGETVSFAYPLSGDIFYGLLAAGEQCAVNDLVESSGDGTLDQGSTAAIGRALDAVDNSAGYVPARVRVEVI